MPKIAFTADLHLGITSSKTIRKLVDAIAASEPDAVVVAGDLGEPLHVFERCLDLFQKFHCPVGILPGNHDVWTHPNDDYDSADLFFNRLPRAVRSRDMVWLESDELRLAGGVVIVGTIGWYDYSCRSGPTADWTDAQFADAKPSLNNDGNYVTWPFSDPEFARKMCDNMERRLASATADQAASHVVVVTHMPAFPEQLIQRHSDDGIASAYYANFSLGRLLVKHPKVCAVVSGHTHRGVPFTSLSRQANNPLLVATVGSEYLSPTFVAFEF